MWVLTYKDGRIFMEGRGPFHPDNFKMEILDVYEIPDQDLSHLYTYDNEGAREINGRWPDDIPLHFDKMKADKHKAAIQALKARPIAREKSIADLRERVALYEEILGLGNVVE